MRKIHPYFILAGFLCFPASVALACGIEGKATRTDGSKVDGMARVSTNWNSNNYYLTTPMYYSYG
jgi:hypothetical protein